MQRILGIFLLSMVSIQTAEAGQSGLPMLYQALTSNEAFGSADQPRREATGRRKPTLPRCDNASADSVFCTSEAAPQDGRRKRK